ncbi:MAG: 30S ribosomal protein S2 [Candidatus Magasanikbacteria bacterium CG10_big_fil_rev_8_21_14_0_10_36_32]|uniref:Small ribosomal subunit protein uS2 n=1 Tax=Candidatus Magasanikbacteria bacterium CG10_big_fil_rev_8_21_14_0_10_36_32 TaxID=1974646 RepID=A0A2M6W697_9BACT|nr:MAG: 30S ribosomal protein S2 [Candidatus Magasanikbacteria bacterium CG10_big_fil_rev_8_21_14_0_10_36_32]
MNLLPSLAEMLKLGVHFGHQKSRWHPKMKQYIFGTRNGVHIIDLEKTLEEMDKTLSFVKNLAAEGKVILFVGTKRQARDLIKAAAENCGMPYLVERWIGGLMTNFEEMKRRLKKYLSMKEQVASGEVEKYTKKEQIKFKKDLEKMDKYLIGLSQMDKMPDALYIADLRTEKTATAEANRTNVPIIAVCDTNVDPTDASYIIPANDDAVNSIKLMADAISNAVNEGKKEYDKKKAVAVANEEKNRAEAIKPRRVMKKEESL